LPMRQGTAKRKPKPAPGILLDDNNPGGFLKAMKLMPDQVDRIVIHTAAAATTKTVKTPLGMKQQLVAVDQPYSVVDSYHRSKGWDGIGYGEYVRFDGSRTFGRGYDKVGAHVEGFNSASYGICGSGHGDVQPFTAAQLKGMVNATVDALEHFGLVRRFKANPMVVIGHREVNVLIDTGKPQYQSIKRTYKTCPGTKNDMGKFRKAVIAEVKRRKL
jgi:hypothetical protein